MKEPEVKRESSPPIDSIPKTRERGRENTGASPLELDIEAILAPCCQQTDKDQIAVACEVLSNMRLSGTDEDMTRVESLLHSYVKFEYPHMRPTIASTIIKRLNSGST